MKRKIVKTDQAPAAIGPYNQGVVVHHGDLLFTAGQIPLNPATGQVVGETIEEQTRQVLENLKAVVEAAGGRMDTVVKTTVFLKDMTDFPRMNIVYESYFDASPPARSAVEVARLPKDVKIEIEAVAQVKG